MDYQKAASDASELTGKASDVARHLAFAGIAIIWVFSGGGTENVEEVDLSDFRWTLYVFAFALALDFIQYAWQSIMMRRFLVENEDALKAPGGEQYPPTLREWADRLFRAKLLFVAVGYALLLVQIGMNI